MKELIKLTKKMTVLLNELDKTNKVLKYDYYIIKGAKVCKEHYIYSLHNSKTNELIKVDKLNIIHSWLNIRNKTSIIIYFYCRSKVR